MNSTLTMWHALIVLTVMGLLLIFVRGIVKGYTQLRPGMPVFHRNDHPGFYWATIVFWGIMLAMSVAGATNIFFGDIS